MKNGGKMVESEAEIKISRAKISLQKSQPFWAYLSLYLKPIETKQVPTMAVDINGNLLYNSEFVNGLNDEEMLGLIAHELGHIIFMTFSRGEKLNHQVFNIASDISINQILKDNNFVLPNGVLWSDYDNNIQVYGKVVKDVPSKQSEEIYYEIYDDLKDKLKKQLKSGKFKVGEDGIEIDIEDLGYEVEGSTNDGSGKAKSIDSHIKSNKKMSKEETEAKLKEWTNRVVEAGTISRMAGNEPKGLERIIGQLHSSKIGWKQLLQRYIQSYIPSNYTYQSPSKKSISSGYFMPNVEKERVEIYCCVDLSGSIGEKEMVEFLSEIVGIAKAYREKIKFHLWAHETSVNDKYIIENGSVDKILKLKMHGGGGTSHTDCFEQLRKERDCKCCIFFTDGFSDLNSIDFKKNRFDSIFLISKGGDKSQLDNKPVRVLELK